MKGTVSRYPTRHDLASLTYIAAKSPDILVINAIDLIRTEFADLPSKGSLLNHQNDPPLSEGDLFPCLEGRPNHFALPACFPAFPDKQHSLRYHLVLGALLALWSLPGSLLQMAFHQNRPSLVQILST
jgi:hypothetical protein